MTDPIRQMPITEAEFSHARSRSGNRTASTGIGDPAIVAFSQAEWLSFDNRPSSGCVAAYFFLCFSASSSRAHSRECGLMRQAASKCWRASGRRPKCAAAIPNSK